jgi:hypothetical protein
MKVSSRDRHSVVRRVYGGPKARRVPSPDSGNARALVASSEKREARGGEFRVRRKRPPAPGERGTKLIDAIALGNGTSQTCSVTDDCADLASTRPPAMRGTSRTIEAGGSWGVCTND